VAHAIYTLAPKSRLGDLGEVLEKGIPLPSDVVEFCRKSFGMSKETAEECLDILLNLGEKFGASVDGVPHRVRIGIGVGTRRGFEGIIRLVDEMGDPPFVTTMFKCPGCGKEYCADDMVSDELYYCEECFTWLVYDGFEVKKATPWSDCSHVTIQVVEKATGIPIPNLRLAIRKKTAVTDEKGYVRFEHLPYGDYELKILVGNRELKVLLSVRENYTSLKLSIAECCECGYPWIEVNGGVGGKYQCPWCGTVHLIEGNRIYRLKQGEAFCYDFNNDNLVLSWRLACPNCRSILSLEFSSGKWICPNCDYVEPQHGYRLFRCILPCGHEDVFNIHYLTDDIPFKCRVCGVEAKLPTHVRSAWKGFNPTPLDMLVKGAVHLEYFVRRNPWVVPVAIIGGPIAFGLAILGLPILLGGKGEG
jgi:predicted RNA-binding Zn-ribbon protein involved in translation (DUF1610 family)